MIDYNSEIGKIYGCYQILEFLPHEIKKKRQCKVKCLRCGNIKIIDYQHLKNRLYKDCPECKPKPQLTYDLTGQRFGMLTVIKRVENHVQKNGSTKVQYECLCDCGNTCIVQSTHLRSKHSTSCGCFSKKLFLERHLKDITGNRYGKLTAVERIWINNKPYWRCVCDCGREKITEVRYLNSGKVNSCGCLFSVAQNKMKEILEKNNIKYQEEYMLDDCRDVRRLPFDFAIFNENKLVLLVELQGQQHYYPFTFNSENKEIKNENLKDRIKKDNIKRQYCIDNNIPLLEIKYTKFDKIEEIFKSFCEENKIDLICL